MLITFLSLFLSQQETRLPAAPLAGLARALERCLSRDQRCAEAEKPSLRITALFEELRSRGGDDSLSLLFRLEARGFWQAAVARTAVFERRLERALPALACTPPDRTLATATYFRAALESPASAPAPLASGPAAATGDVSFRAALMRGDLPAASRSGDAYARARGFPVALRRDEQDETWGGNRADYLLLELAAVHEALGHFREANALYTLASPYGLCGAGASARWVEQTAARIRTSELGGACAVALRLIDVRPSQAKLYGPARLAEAGFDVARLYRGALLLGVGDAWDREVFAIEGLADSEGRAALPALLDLSRFGVLAADPRASEAVRIRALNALAQLVKRPPACRDDDLSCIGGVFSSEWQREIKAVQLSSGERREIGAHLALALDDPDEDVVIAAVAAFSALGDVAYLPALRALRPGQARLASHISSVCQGALCRSALEAAVAAAEAQLAPAVPTGAVQRIERRWIDLGPPPSSCPPPRACSNGSITIDRTCVVSGDDDDRPFSNHVDPAICAALFAAAENEIAPLMRSPAACTRFHHHGGVTLTLVTQGTGDAATHADQVHVEGCGEEQPWQAFLEKLLSLHP